MYGNTVEGGVVEEKEKRLKRIIGVLFILGVNVSRNNTRNR